jgi:hypothetical protein
MYTNTQQKICIKIDENVQTGYNLITEDDICDEIKSKRRRENEDDSSVFISNNFYSIFILLQKSCKIKILKNTMSNYIYMLLAKSSKFDNI